MFRFFRQIRQRLFNEGKVSRYIGYAVGEILLIVVGILIALEMSDWKLASQLAREKAQLLQSLKLETEANIANLDKTIEEGQKVLDSLRLLINLHDSGLEQVTWDEEIDEALLNATSYQRIRPSFAVLNAMVSTGSNDLLPAELAKQLALNQASLLQGQSDESLAEIAFQDLIDATISFGGWISIISPTAISRIGMPEVERTPNLVGLLNDDLFAEYLFRRLLFEHNITNFYKDERVNLAKTLSMIDDELSR